MPSETFVHYNGVLISAGDAIISPDSRGFKFGDGFFETMKLLNGNIVLAGYHFERLFYSLATLQFQVPAFLTPAYLNQEVLKLVHKNEHSQSARIRITIFRGDGGLYDEGGQPRILIQSWPLQPPVWIESGISIGIYRDACKSADKFSAIKNNNYLPYTMAAIWARQHQLQDALLLNAKGRIADATIANVFILHDGIIKTPALTEGAVNGVMRRHLLAALQSNGWKTMETEITEEMLQQCTECFLTNVISGIRWVKTAENNTYQCHTAATIYNTMIRAQLW